MPNTKTILNQRRTEMEIADDLDDATLPKRKRKRVMTEAEMEKSAKARGEKNQIMVKPQPKSGGRIGGIEI